MKRYFLSQSFVTKGEKFSFKRNFISLSQLLPQFSENKQNKSLKAFKWKKV